MNPRILLGLSPSPTNHYRGKGWQELGASRPVSVSSKLAGALQPSGIFSVGKIVIKLAIGFLIKRRRGPSRRGAVSAGGIGGYPPSLRLPLA